jgi:hypothetical protein
MGKTVRLVINKSLNVSRLNLAQSHVAEVRQQMIFGIALLSSQTAFGQVSIAVARISAPFFILAGYMSRRQNRWAEGERDFKTAVQLDPRNPNAYNLLSDTYILERRFPEADAFDAFVERRRSDA